ncbi:hypothetical protein ACP4OV_024262 [Aristida adscensionis]
MEGAAAMPMPQRPPQRRGVTLAEQLAASSNLRDLLKLPDDDGAVAGRRARRRRRTLLDAIRGGADDGEEDRAPGAGAGAARAPAAAGGAPGERVSLMALLERTEREWAGCPGGGHWKRVNGGGEEEDEEGVAAAAEGEKRGGGGVGGRCCVCVARGKGAAFIPCGHTFCRACARELRAGRGRCPLCNAAIREVLNLF